MCRTWHSDLKGLSGMFGQCLQLLSRLTFQRTFLEIKGDRLRWVWRIVWVPDPEGNIYFVFGFRTYRGQKWQLAATWKMSAPNDWNQHLRIPKKIWFYFLKRGSCFYDRKLCSQNLSEKFHCLGYCIPELSLCIMHTTSPLILLGTGWTPPECPLALWTVLM